VECYQGLVEAAYAAVAPAPGARELLAAAKARGWIVAVVTSNAGARVRRWLERTELAGLVAFVVAGEDTARGKPHPDPYLAALARSACAAERSLAVEDSPQGVAAALAAGLPTYAYQPVADAAIAWPSGVLTLSRLDDLKL
jgi:HAD superfamily hydrolase (TIGR01509 family)